MIIVFEVNVSIIFNLVLHSQFIDTQHREIIMSSIDLVYVTVLSLVSISVP